MSHHDSDPAVVHDTTTEVTDLAGDDLRDGPRIIGGLHYIAWVFIVFAIGDLVWYIANATFSASPSPADYVVYALQVLPAVATILFPAVLLARHPDATTRAPLLLFGSILLAFVQGLLILATPLKPVFGAITPESQDVPFVLLLELYNVATLTIAAIGLVFIARGLSLARRYEDRSGRWIDWIVPLATVFATVVGIVAASRLSLGDGPVPAAVVVYIAANVILGIVRVAAWAYVTASAARGWLAGENPLAGWRLAALGGAVIVFALVLVNVGGILDIQDASIIEAYGWVVVIAYAVGHLSLLAAFAVGLPSLDDPDDEDEAFDSALPEHGGPVFDDEFPEETIR